MARLLAMTLADLARGHFGPRLHNGAISSGRDFGVGPASLFATARSVEHEIGPAQWVSGPRVEHLGGVFWSGLIIGPWEVCREAVGNFLGLLRIIGGKLG